MPSFYFFKHSLPFSTAALEDARLRASTARLWQTILFNYCRCDYRRRGTGLSNLLVSAPLERRCILTPRDDKRPRHSFLAARKAPILPVWLLQSIFSTYSILNNGKPGFPYKLSWVALLSLLSFLTCATNACL